MVFRSFCIAYDVISAERFDAYARWIGDYVVQYPDAWMLIYQADARTRREHATRVKHMLMAKHEKAINNGKLSEFDPSHPWEMVWDVLVTKRGDWWEKQVKGSCQAIAMGLKKMSAYVGGGALIAQGGQDFIIAFAHSVPRGYAGRDRPFTFQGRNADASTAHARATHQST